MYIKEEHMFQISIRYVGKVRVPAEIREIMNLEFRSKEEAIAVAKVLNCVYRKSGITFSFYEQGELIK